MPAQPLLGAPPLVDQVVAMVDQQLQLAQRRLTWARTIQVRFPQGGPCDGERVDRIGLTARTPGAPLGRHQLRRHPHQRLARGEQPPLERAGQLAAVLNRPQPLRTERARPGDKLQRGADGQLRPSASDLVDGNRRQRLLVHVHSDHDHRIASYRCGATGERTDLTRGSSHAPIRSRSAVSGRRRRHNAGKSAHGRRSGIESAAADPSLLRHTGRHHQHDDDSEMLLCLSSSDWRVLE